MFHITKSAFPSLILSLLGGIVYRFSSLVYDPSRDVPDVLERSFIKGGTIHELFAIFSGPFHSILKFLRLRHIMSLKLKRSFVIIGRCPFTGHVSQICKDVSWMLEIGSYLSNSSTL